MIIDCDRCAVRGVACGNCAVTFVARPAERCGHPGNESNHVGTRESHAGDQGKQLIELDAAEVRALTVLATAGMVPPLRYAPRPAPEARPQARLEARPEARPQARPEAQPEEWLQGQAEARAERRPAGRRRYAPKSRFTSPVAKAS